MGAAISIDGGLVPAEGAAIPVMDRGFLYGDSAFEVLRTYGGRPFEMWPHLTRLAASCVSLGIPAPELAGLGREIAEAIAAGDNPESYVRVIVTRGVTAMGLAMGGELVPRRIVVVLPLPPQPPAMYAEGVALATVTMARALDGSAASGAKASNYLPNILALAQAKERGASEAISVAAGGELLEGSTSNLFLVQGGVVSTPPLSVGILGGITRRVVLEAAAAEDVPVHERLLYPSDLYGADEAFITSTLREIVPAVRADGVALGDGSPGPVTLRLREAFTRRAQALLAQERG